MAEKATYQIHQRTTLSALEADLRDREPGVDSGGEVLSVPYNSTMLRVGMNRVWDMKFFGAKTDGSDCSAAFTQALNSYILSPRPIVFPEGTFVFASNFTLNASHNGIQISGSGLFNTTLRYTGTGDFLLMGGNLNGVTLRDFRLYSTTGRDAISITDGVATAIPDAGVLYFCRLDIRGFLRHGIKARLTVDVRTEALQVVSNGGCGLFIENANPYRSTTWTDTSSWFHENGGHGIAIKGTFTQTFLGTISDSNTGVSTDIDTISCAGYTLIGGGTWTNCVSTDIGKVVTQGGVTVGTLAHYDNTHQHMIIDCTTIPTGTGALALKTGTGAGVVIYLDSAGYTNAVAGDIGKTVQRAGVTVGTLTAYDNTLRTWTINASAAIASAGAMTIVTGTGAGTNGTYGASTTSTFRKNSHGLYAARSAYINVQGGHFENHTFGIFLDATYQSTIMPGYFLTQGTGAWGLYCAGNCRRIVMGGFGSDVQPGGAGDVYFGPLTKGMILHGGHGATGYTFTNRSEDSYVLTSEDDNPIIMAMKSSSVNPITVTGSNATEVYISATNSSTSGVAGYRLSVNGWTKDFYLEQTTGNIVFKSSGAGKFIGLYGAGADRADQRLFWASSDGQKAWEIGPTTGVMAGADVEADFAAFGYDDAGTNPYTALSIIRSTRLASIMAGKSASTRANLGGVVVQQVTSVGSVNAAETDLWSVSVPANTLARNGDSLRVICGGTTAANANTKRFKAYFGATAGLNTGALALNNSQWNVEIFVQRLTATTQSMIVRFFTNDALLYCYSQTSTATETLSGAVTFRLTATATTTNDVVCTAMQGKWDPGT